MAPVVVVEDQVVLLVVVDEIKWYFKWLQIRSSGTSGGCRWDQVVLQVVVDEIKWYFKVVVDEIKWYFRWLKMRYSGTLGYCGWDCVVLGAVIDEIQWYPVLILDEIQWYELCESTPSTKEQALLCFGDLASAFRILHVHSKDWTEDSVISVIDELISRFITQVSYFLFYTRVS